MFVVLCSDSPGAPGCLLCTKPNPFLRGVSEGRRLSVWPDLSVLAGPRQVCAGSATFPRRVEAFSDCVDGRRLRFGSGIAIAVDACEGVGSGAATEDCAVTPAGFYASRVLCSVPQRRSVTPAPAIAAFNATVRITQGRRCYELSTELWSRGPTALSHCLVVGGTKVVGIEVTPSRLVRFGLNCTAAIHVGRGTTPVPDTGGTAVWVGAPACPGAAVRFEMQQIPGAVVVRTHSRECFSRCTGIMGVEREVVAGRWQGGRWSVTAFGATADLGGGSSPSWPAPSVCTAGTPNATTVVFATASTAPNCTATSASRRGDPCGERSAKRPETTYHILTTALIVAESILMF